MRSATFGASRKLMTKAEIIPAINAENFDGVKRQVELVRPFAEWVHLDIADGTFTPNVLWHDFRDLLGFEANLKLELHLMLSDIDTRIDDWIMANVSRIIFHLEASRDPQFVLSRIKSADIKPSVGILIDTPWEKTEPFWSGCDTILLLAVNPGKAGQTMDSGTPAKAAGLHAACPQCQIEIDGGVNIDNAKALKESGAGILVAASAIFGQPDVKKALGELENL